MWNITMDDVIKFSKTQGTIRELTVDVLQY